MTHPLPVDVVTSTWDYVVDAVGIVSGLATAGALLIAASAYKRQVDEGLRRQATMVTIKTVVDGSLKRTTIRVENGSDQPVLLTNVGFVGQSGHDGVEIPPNFNLPVTLLADEKISIAHFDSSMKMPRTTVRFDDIAGRAWQRTNYGGLAQIPKTRLQRAKYNWQMKRRGVG